MYDVLIPEHSARAFKAEARAQGLVTGKEISAYANNRLKETGCIAKVNLFGNDVIIRKDYVTVGGLMKLTAGLAGAEGLKLIGENPYKNNPMLKLEHDIELAKNRVARLELKRS